MSDGTHLQRFYIAETRSGNEGLRGTTSGNKSAPDGRNRDSAMMSSFNVTEAKRQRCSYNCIFRAKMITDSDPK